jgi:Sulfatase
MTVARRVEPYLLPAVYAAIPLATLAADNAALVRPGDLLPYYAGIVVASCGGIALTGACNGFSAQRRVGACIAVAMLLAFDYRELRPLLGSITRQTRPSMVFLWAVLVAAVVLATAKLAHRAPRLPTVALAIGVAMLVQPIVRLAESAPTTVGPVQSTRFAPVAHSLRRHPAPDVYFFLLDAYGRADRLRQQFGFDNTPFLSALRTRGFVIPPRSRSSYPFTKWSVPSILNMEYGLVEATPAQTGRNPVASTFRRLGYEFALAPSEFGHWRCKGVEDICVHALPTYPTRIGFSDLTWAVMQRTPAADLLQTMRPSEVSNMAEKRQFPSLVAKAVNAQRDGTRPVFVYGHSLLTHWPYPYQGRRCELQPGEPRGADDYLGALECANSSVLAAMHLITKTDPNAVIVIASDHGSDVGIDGHAGAARWTREDVQRRFSNFVALRLPRVCRDAVPDDLAAVNIFRVVLNCVTTSKLRQLPYRRVL